MKSIKGIIFDYGGTLDTNGVHWFHIFRRVYAECLPQVQEGQLREAYVYAERYLAMHRVIEPNDDFATMLRKKVSIQIDKLMIDDGSSNIGICFDQEQLSFLKCDIADRCDSLVRDNMYNTRQVLDALSARYPLVLVSNFYGNIHAVLRSYGLDGYFSEVIESAVVGIRKPDPQIFALGVEALGLHPHEVLVIGDSYTKDIVPAHSIGCLTVWLRGKGWSSDEQDDCMAADVVICDLFSLLELSESKWIKKE